MVLHCRCLNITVDPSGTKLRGLSALDVPVPHTVRTTFAGGSYGDLVSGQPAVKFSFLVQQSIADTCTLYACRNCGLSACAVSTALNVMVLSADLLDEEKAREVRLSPDYSAAFGIVVEATDEKAESTALLSSADNVISDLQRQLNKFLLSMESKIEEDVRRYEAEARERYRLLTEHSSMQLQVLCRLANTAQPIAVAEKDEGDDDRASERNMDDAGGTTDVRTALSQAIRSVSQENQSAVRVKAASTSVRPSSRDSDALFELDEEEGEKDDPFVCSDEEDIVDETNTVTGSGEVGGVTINRIAKNHNGLQATRLSSSAAMPIPSAMRRRKSQAASDSDEYSSDGDGPMPDMKDMGASIKALAQSVGFDGTEMFGDLPRPRLNTFDRLLM